MNNQAVWYKLGIMTAYMPPYHPRLHKLWWKIYADKENHKTKELWRYQEIYEKIKRREDWNQRKQAAITIQNDHQYFKDNPVRKCLKCHKDVLAGSNNCTYKRVETTYHGRDSTETAYYVGDQAAGEYQAMFHDMFTLCLAKYPRGDTMSYKDGRIGFNSSKE